MTVLLSNIKKLVGIANNNELLRGESLNNLSSIDEAYIVIEDGIISSYGKMDELINPKKQFSHIVDVSNSFVLPAWCDSHTHLVFAGSRENEFVDKINGLTYAEIAAKGGGILNSAKKLQNTSEHDLFSQSWKRLEEVAKLGTGAIEIKSGYGLTVEDELKMLRVIKKLSSKSSLLIKSTFLGAHAFPEKFKDNKQGYIDLIINEMVPVIAKEKLANYIDVFCENGFFSPEQTDAILKAGLAHGLKPKIHANQLSVSKGVEVGVSNNAISVDHLESMDDAALNSLANSNTIGTLLPTAAYFLGMNYPPAREMIANNCAISLASDFNPGSSPSGNMNTVVSMACIQLKMKPAEAINAATINGAYAMELHEQVGSIMIGKRANFIITKSIPSLAFLPYSFGSNLIDKVMINGEFIN